MVCCDFSYSLTVSKYNVSNMESSLTIPGSINNSSKLAKTNNSYLMIVHKTQGQFLDKTKIYLLQPVFNH